MKPILFIGLLAATSVLSAQENILSGGTGPFDGPSILSRGSLSAGRRGGDQVQFRFFGQVSGIYDSGLLPVATTTEGKPQSSGLAGEEAMVGVYGYRTYRHSSLGLDYRGDFRHYSRNSYYDGSDHIFTLEYMTQPTRRIAIVIHPTGGTLSRSYGNFGYYAQQEFAGSGAFPQSDLFDNRSYFFQQGATVIFQKSARLSFSATGQGFLLRRQSKALVDLNGADATGDVAYRLNRRQTIYAAYNYNHYSFPGVFGATDAQGAYAGHSITIGRSLDFDVSAGAMRVETQGLRKVAVDPLIAALTGQATAQDAFHSVTYVPSLRASLSREYHKSRINLGYSQGISPGNGIYLTSRSSMAGIFAGYSGIRRWDFSGGFYRNEISSLGFLPGAFTTYSGGGGAAYRLVSFLHLTARVDARHAGLTASGFRRDAVRASFGLAFAPGDLPISLW